MLQLVGRLLIDVVIEPVSEEQVAMSTPALGWNLLRVVIGEVVARDFDGESLVEITEVLVLECVAVILGVTHDEDLATIIRDGDIGASLFRIGQEPQFGTILYVLAAVACVARVRSAEDIVETTHERHTEIRDLVMENAKHLLGQSVLVNPVVVV